MFWTGDADDKFPHGHSVTVQRDTDYLIDHKITETCPSIKISNNNDEHRVNVNTKHSANNVKLMVSCRCKSTHIYIQNKTKFNCLIILLCLYLPVKSINKGCWTFNSASQGATTYVHLNITYYNKNKPVHESCRKLAKDAGFKLFGIKVRLAF